MSYDLEELQTGIVELFDNAACLSPRPQELKLEMAFRDFKSLDATRLKMKVTRVARTIITLTTEREARREAQPRSRLVCAFCGARALSHRCPVAGWIV